MLAARKIISVLILHQLTFLLVRVSLGCCGKLGWFELGVQIVDVLIDLVEEFLHVLDILLWVEDVLLDDVLVQRHIDFLRGLLEVGSEELEGLPMVVQLCMLSLNLLSDLSELLIDDGLQLLGFWQVGLGDPTEFEWQVIFKNFGILFGLDLLFEIGVFGDLLVQIFGGC